MARAMARCARGCRNALTRQVKGKFHVECFNCFSCHAPFPSGEFCASLILMTRLTCADVFDERPYCSPHYHTLAGSLCTNCDRGIEGSCVSLNESGRKCAFRRAQRMS